MEVQHVLLRHRGADQCRSGPDPDLDIDDEEYRVTRPLVPEDLYRGPDSKFRTPQEVAGILRCSVSSLAKWRRAGTGPAFVRIGSRIRYRLIDLARFVDRNTTHIPPLPTSEQIRQMLTERR